MTLGRYEDPVVVTKTQMTLGTLLDAPGNSFNAVRLIAAIAVVISHSFLLVYGTSDAEPLSWGPYDIGACAVNVFFVLSGLMLSRSYDLKPDWRSFAAARILRIFPALFIAGIVVGWMLAPFATRLTLVDYFSNPETLLYPITSMFAFENAHLPSVFLDSTLPGEIDAPLWTVKYELLAYVLFGAVSAMGLIKSKFTSVAACVLFGLALTLSWALGVLEHSPIGSLVRFGFCFTLGVSLYRFRHRAGLRPLGAIAAIVIAAPLGLTFFGPVAWIASLGYAALCLARIRLPGISAFANRWDISFGIYIYAWPVQQMLMGMPTRDSVWLHLILSLLAAAILGFLSSVLVERPVLKLRPALAARIFPRRRAEVAKAPAQP